MIVNSDIDINFSYDHIPTIEKFSLCNKRKRGVMGPFGCLSGDTEYLTESGWKKFTQYVPGDIVAEFNAETNQIEFEQPLDYIKLPCKEFYHLKNERGIDQLLSEEHTVLFNTAFAPNKWQTISAVDLVEKHNNLSRGFSGRIPSTFEAPRMSGVDLSDDELRLMVAISADGHYPSKTTKCHITLRKDRKKERLRLLLSKCDISWDERNYTGRPTETNFVFDAPHHNKRLWNYFYATKEQLEIISDEFVHWDGCMDKYGGRIFSSTVKEDADFIQYALSATGVRATIAEVEYDKENWKKGYRVYAGTGATLLSLRQAPKINKVPSEDGFKYCFETKTGFFVARRKGRIFITGNSAKSSGCLWELIQRAMEQEPGSDGIRRTRWAIIRNSYPQLRDTTIKTVLDWLPPMIFGDYLKASHDYIITGFEGLEIEFMFRALDKPEHVSNLLSLELTGAWINEAREVPWAIIDAVDGRIGRFPSIREGGCTWKGIIMDTNPPDEDSDWYRFFEEELPENAAIFKQPSGLSPEAENICAPDKTPEDYPKGHRPGLENDYYTELAKGKPKTYIDVFIHGEYGYTREGKPVYESCYNDDIHVSKVPLIPVKDREVIVAFDFGLTPSAIFLQATPRGTINILDELISDGIGIKQFVTKSVNPLLATKYNGFKIMVTGDPAGNQRAQTDEKTCFDILIEFGFKVESAYSNDLVARIGAVENFLSSLTDGKATFQLDPSCRVLRKGFNSGYCFRRIQGSGDRYTEEPMKNLWSHPHDALQYGCMLIFGVIAEMKRALKKRPKGPKHVAASPGGY